MTFHFGGAEASPGQRMLAGSVATLFSAGVLAGLFALATPAVLTAASAAETDQQKQFCIAHGGVNGDTSYVGACNYSDYQQCAEAAVAYHGNCVGNIDYHPGATPSAPGRRARRAR